MLMLQVYSSAARSVLLADFTSRLDAAVGGGGLSFATNAHGFQALAAPLIPMGIDEAFEVYDWPGTPHVVVSDVVAGVVWEGRLEDIEIVSGGVALTALGYQRALSDLPYTAVWSDASTAGWEPAVYGVAAADRYEMDNNNRLYIAPREGESFSNDDHYGIMSWAVPVGGQRLVSTFTADYAMVLPTNWVMEVVSADDDFTGQSILHSVTGNGATQTGSISETGIGAPRLLLRARNLTGSTATLSAPSGTNYVKLTSARVKTGSAATVTASEIAGALAGWVNAINSGQLEADGSLIEATTTDLRDEMYEDVYPAAILDRLAFLHGYEWAVWEGRHLSFYAKGTAGRRWYVDAAADVGLQRSIENVRNSAYATYQEEGGRRMRTATAGSADSQGRFGLVRRGVVNAQTTSATTAAVFRDTYLADRATMTARANVVFERVFDATGASYPLYNVRAGDRITIRNLPPTLSTEIDRVRTFLVAETSYDAASGVLDVAPEEPAPTLDRLIARREAGF